MSAAPTFPFREPVKAITTAHQLQVFRGSPTYRSLIAFIQRLGEGVQGLPNSHPCALSKHVEAVLEVLDTLSKWVDEIPPLAQPMRYGNKAFRIWHEKVEQNLLPLHQIISKDVNTPLGPLPAEGVAIELGPYLLDSLGNRTRIDYGTGHELHFVAWLYCLQSIGVLRREDEKAIVLKIFVAYLTLVRKVQQVYGLEPAGSHGVWSLDDYQFIPFIWGASQLINNPAIKPASITDPAIVDKFYPEYLYLGCIKYILTVKKGPFHEHSPDLYRISGAASWEKIRTGMLRKFEDDVTSKFPIMQHFLFGSVITFA
eukprot:TRINITY_DN4893_c0_g1_i1.p1 TRINITY_DN4893_c0_g1~~TRINITY_DN4893_c0_g1_i1.p1  ORF type:complete len:329 (-),score=40.10 TRINITY_DN4893_c0_g1_i1:97-1035(-)